MCPFSRYSIGCSALDWDLAVMEEFRSQKCYSHMNNLQTTSRDTKDSPKVLRCVWINTNRQSVPVTPKARYFKKNLQHLLGAKWQRDLETQEELDKFLEIWCGDRINPCKKKLSGAEHTQRKFCVDFRAHEPGIFTFSPWKVCDFAKIEFGILKVFFYMDFIFNLVRFARILLVTPHCWDLAVTLLPGELPKSTIRMSYFCSFQRFWCVKSSTTRFQRLSIPSIHCTKRRGSIYLPQIRFSDNFR